MINNLLKLAIKDLHKICKYRLRPYWTIKESRLLANYARSLPKLERINSLKCGNYKIPKSVKFDNNSVIYSVGVGKNVKFDICLNRIFKCEIHLFDPTPVSYEYYIKCLADKDFLNFHQYGVWIENAMMDFYSPKTGGSSSILKNSRHFDDPQFSGKCHNLSTIFFT